MFDWPTDGQLVVPLTSEVLKAQLLAEPNKELTVEKDKRGVVVHVPAVSPSPYAGVVVLAIKGAPKVK